MILFLIAAPLVAYGVMYLLSSSRGDPVTSVAVAAGLIVLVEIICAGIIWQKLDNLPDELEKMNKTRRDEDESDKE